MLVRHTRSIVQQPLRHSAAVRACLERVVGKSRRGGGGGQPAGVPVLRHLAQLAQYPHPQHQRSIAAAALRWHSTDTITDNAATVAAPAAETASPAHYITTTAGVHAICEAAREAGFIAFDTEFHLEKSFFIHLALLQCAVGGHIYCVDPLASDIDLSAFEELMGDANVVKIVHGERKPTQHSR